MKENKYRFIVRGVCVDGTVYLSKGDLWSGGGDWITPAKGYTREEATRRAEEEAAQQTDDPDASIYRIQVIERKRQSRRMRAILAKERATARAEEAREDAWLERAYQRSPLWR